MSTDKPAFDTVIEIDTETLFQSFAYLYHMDWSNAMIHQASVKFSPLTFALSSILRDSPIEGHPFVEEVEGHRGMYPLDTGR